MATRSDRVLGQEEMAYLDDTLGQLCWRDALLWFIRDHPEIPHGRMPPLTRRMWNHIKRLEQQRWSKEMANNLEETGSQPYTQVDPANPPLPPQMARFKMLREVEPRTLGLLIFNGTELPWRMSTRSTTQMGHKYLRMQVEVKYGDLPVYPKGEPLEDRKMRLLIGVLLNLRSWDDILLLERQDSGILIGVPPGYLDPTAAWPYPVPITQNGYPMHRVVWDFQQKQIFCTCGQSREFPHGTLEQTLKRISPMRPDENNTLVCGHKEIVCAMQHYQMLDGLEEGKVQEWMPWIPT